MEKLSAWTDRIIKSAKRPKFTQKSMKERQNIIGLVGYARSGKDTLGSYLCEKHGYTRLAFADPVRDALYAVNPIVIAVTRTIIDENGNPCVFYSGERLHRVVDVIGWDLAKVAVPEIRTLLQRIGTEMGREIFGQDFWVSLAENVMNRNLETSYVITDIRFGNELDMLHRRGATLFRVERDGVAKINDHASEQYIEADIPVIKNNGSLQDLFNQIDKLIDNK